MEIEEIIGAGEEAIGSIKLGIMELEGIEEYSNIIKYLEDSITEIERVKREYGEE